MYWRTIYLITWNVITCNVIFSSSAHLKCIQWKQFFLCSYSWLFWSNLRNRTYYNHKSKPQSWLRQKCPGSGNHHNFIPDLKERFPVSRILDVVLCPTVGPLVPLSFYLIPTSCFWPTKRAKKGEGEVKGKQDVPAWDC